MRTCIIVTTVVVLGSMGAAHADGGIITYVPHVKVFEPNQRAVIAWNGQEEILILSTDTYASKPTKGLEIIPLRTEPEVKKADPWIFDKATELINRQNARREPPVFRGWGPPQGAPVPSSAMPAGEITQKKRVGRHEIAVTHVLDEDGFCKWAEEYLRSQGVETPKIPAHIRITVKDYLKKGFTWFVYDVVELGTSVQTNDPIQFRFKSDCVFYPLVITQTANWKVDIQILLLTPTYLWTYPELPRDHIRVGLQRTPHEKAIDEEMVFLSQSQVEEISPDINDLFGHSSGMKLRIWSLIPETTHGRFIHDLVAR